MNDELSSMAANGIIQAAATEFQFISARMMDPDVLFRPQLSIDGNQWCALYGENLQDGVAGFGETPAMAMADFNRNWFKRIVKQELIQP